ncbi:hypothetical protein [Cellulosimicrobium sp. SH8]|uniref:hypothetical protein n=1 Tax=Cellulosimicrobium sp. SH8 TaxID=2952936 RepID=UPI0021F3579E|nr:hypothetical protein [Cellulosimicrobium sp. SH8]
MSAARALWGKIQEPKVITCLVWVIYLVTLVVGLTALTDPPSSIEGEIGLGLTRMWAGFLVLGGTIGVVATLPGIWWLERAAVLSVVTGLAIYCAVALNLHFAEASGNRLPQAGVIAIAALGLGTRWFRIRRYAYDPEPPVHRHDV